MNDSGCVVCKLLYFSGWSEVLCKIGWFMDVMDMSINVVRENNGVKFCDYNGLIGSYDKVIGRVFFENGNVFRLFNVNVIFGNW